MRTARLGAPEEGENFIWAPAAGAFQVSRSWTLRRLGPGAGTNNERQSVAEEGVPRHVTLRARTPGGTMTTS
jgi:hypothetical protein